MSPGVGETNWSTDTTCPGCVTGSTCDTLFLVFFVLHGHLEALLLISWGRRNPQSVNRLTGQVTQAAQNVRPTFASCSVQLCMSRQSFATFVLRLALPVTPHQLPGAAFRVRSIPANACAQSCMSSPASPAHVHRLVCRSSP